MTLRFFWGRSSQLMEEFKEMYKETMIRDNAQDYYYFSDEYFNSILDNLKYNMLIFYADLNGEKIAMSIIIF